MKWKDAGRSKKLFANRHSLKLDSPLEMLFIHFIKVILSIEFIMIMSSMLHGFFSLLSSDEACSTPEYKLILSFILITLFLLRFCGKREREARAGSSHSISQLYKHPSLFGFFRLASASLASPPSHPAASYQDCGNIELNAGVSEYLRRAKGRFSLLDL